MQRGFSARLAALERLEACYEREALERLEAWPSPPPPAFVDVLAELRALLVAIDAGQVAARNSAWIAGAWYTYLGPLTEDAFVSLWPACQLLSRYLHEYGRDGVYGLTWNTAQYRAWLADHLGDVAAWASCADE